MEAAGACQLRLQGEAWPAGAALRVRMGLHSGEAHVQEGDYVDHAPINRCARVKAAAHGGQVLVTKTTRDLVEGRLSRGFGLKRLGEFRLRDLAEPELIYQLTHADLPAGFPPIRTLAERGLRPLPVGITSLVGREQAIAELAGLLARPEVRLVTLTRPGGVGKTRLALAVGERVSGRFGSGTVFVPLAGVTQPDLAVGGIGRAVGADLAGTGAPLQALAEQLGDGRWPLILDNLEQVSGAGRDLGELLADCPGVVMLATSRTVLGLRAEREYPVPPLPLPAGLPADAAGRPLQELMASPAVALFVDRARAVRYDFALTEGNAAATGAEVGDDQAALAARERLAPLLDGIGDPYLRAVSQLVMAWTSGIGGDFDGALREASVGLEQLRGQDEPFWTALAAYTAGLVEMTVGRYDDALGHLTEARDLAERFNNPWLAAVSRVYLGTLAVARGRPEEARALLDEGLELSLAAHSTRGVTLCLAAFARLAFVAGDPGRAALLAGTAEGLRRRAGLQAWPLLRREEAELVAQVRQALGADRFDQVFAAGARLTQQEAVAAVRAGAAPAPR